MPIITEEIDEIKLTSFTDTQKWIDKTHANLTRIPIKGFLQNNSTFRDDEYFGDGDYLVHFNNRGFQAFCNTIGFRLDHLALIESPTLTTQVLNDLIRQRRIYDRLKNHEFVIDNSKNTIIGLVSKSYIGYSNKEFLTDIEKTIIKLPGNGGFEFFEAYGINTELTVVFKSQKKHGVIFGKGGKSEDKSELGLQFKNSMVGTSSVNLNYYLYRLACANGMMVPASQAINRVYHSGSKDTFHDRMDRCFNEVYRKIDTLKDMLEKLGNINFDPWKVAQDNILCNRIFDIIPGTKQKMSENFKKHLRYPKNISNEDKENLRIKHDATLIEKIPNFLGGEHSKSVFGSNWRDNTNMFDFINIFTEKAKTESISDKLSIEEKSGALAKYIAENAKKF